MTNGLSVRNVIACLAAAVSLTVPVLAHAQASVSYKSATIANQLTSWSTVPVGSASTAGAIPDLTVNQFDPSRGTLTSVTLTYTWTSHQECWIKNTDVNDEIFYLDDSVLVFSILPNGQMLAGGPPDITLGAIGYDPVFGLDIASGPLPVGSYLSAGPSDNTGTTKVTLSVNNGDDLSPYYGTGIVSFPTTGLGTFTLEAMGGNYDTGSTTTCGATISVQYNYIPSSPYFVTYTQGGWHAPANGTNPGAILNAGWALAVPTGTISIGTGKQYSFDSAAAVQAFLPQGGANKVLPGSALDSTNTKTGNICGQLLSVKLALGFSNAGVYKKNLGSLVVQSGPLAGKSVNFVVQIADALVGGSAVPAGTPAKLSIDDVATCLNNINNCYDGGSTGNGYIK